MNLTEIINNTFSNKKEKTVVNLMPLYTVINELTFNNEFEEINQAIADLTFNSSHQLILALKGSLYQYRNKVNYKKILYIYNKQLPQ